MWDIYHLDIPLRKSLTQSMGAKLPDIVDEARMNLDAMVGNPAGQYETFRFSTP